MMPYLRYTLAILSFIGHCAIAAPSGPSGDSKHWYRYYNENGIPTLSERVTEEHMRRGYEELDSNMQVLRRYPAFDSVAYEKDRAKREQQQLQKMDDEKLLRLYASARDAELARNRQLDTLETNIGYNTLQLVRIKRLRAELVEQAAEQERMGKSPPVKIKTQISQFDKQISDLQTLINDQRAEQNKVRSDFLPIIQRLTNIEAGH